MKKEIFETTDYDIFKKHELNREIDGCNLNKIITSIKMKNMLINRPILVDKDMRVKDGQHRLEAAKYLQIPIFYEIQSGECNDSDMYLLNDNQKSWSMTDYFNFYCKQGKENYLIIQREAKKLNLNSRLMTILLVGRGGTKTGELKRGIIPKVPEEKLKKVEENVAKIKEFIEFLNTKLIKQSRFITSQSFFVALYFISGLDGFNWNSFFEKTEVLLDKIRPCRGVDGYINLFLNIYNYKRREKIESDYYSFT
jgi:hypothetical protein